MSKWNFKPQAIAKFIVALGFITSAFLVSPVQAQARSYSIDQLDVKIVVNEDSTVSVEETLNYTFLYGKFNGMFREITTSNRTNLQACESNAALQCGGFDFISIDGVKVDGKEVEPGRYETSDVSSGAEDRLRVQYRFSDEAVSLNNERHSFSVRYTLLGSIGFFEDYALFYWNAIFPDRDVPIKKANVEIKYPGEVQLDRANSQVLSPAVSYTGPEATATGIHYQAINIAPRLDFTILQKIPLDSVVKPGNLQLELNPADQNLSFSGITLSLVGNKPLVKSLPQGSYRLTFSKEGYFTKDIAVSIESGKTSRLSVTLEETPLHRLLTLLVLFANLCCCILAIIAPFAAFFIWFTRGRDAGDRDKVEIPEFSPPEGMRPYLLGTLKDERADLTDITSGIIDLAYRGHLKIIEIPAKGLFGSKDFELEKISDKQSDLDDVEKKLMDAIFKSGDSTKLSSLKYKFYTTLPVLQGMIYRKLVSKGYFKTNPDTTRNNWLGFGIAVLVVGVSVGAFLIGVGIFTAIFSAVIVGIVLIVVSRFMPAKTATGTEALRQIRGFRMYLETAEKHTLQNLTPERFEAFLPYAMVFGIERQWAEKFKDIYTTTPDWYVGSNNTFNSLVLADSLRGFNNQTRSTLAAAPSNSSSSGSGFSSGGGFSGGFSGGGGGGGGGGAW